MTVEDLRARLVPLAEAPHAEAGSEPFHSRALLGVAACERLQAEVEPYLHLLADELPGLLGVRRLYDGAWVLGVAGTLPHGRDGSQAWCRYELDLHIDLAEHTAIVICHRTVHRRDLPTDWTAVPLADDGTPGPLDDLRAFVESTALVFAERVVAGGGRG